MMTVGSLSSLYSLNNANGMSWLQNAQQQNASLADQVNAIYSQKGNNGGINTSQFNFVSSSKQNASKLQTALRDLSRSTTYTSKTPTSSDPDAVAVSGSSRYGFSSSNEIKVGVKQLASGQTNKGDALEASATSALSGEHQFAINKAGRQYQFTIQVGAGDTNETVQQKMADAINKAEIGITASVERQPFTKNNALTLSADGTGDSNTNRFTISDINGGEAVAQMGAAHMEHDASDAIYTINGQERTSSTNDVYVGNGITATLKEVTEEDVVISGQQNTAGVMDKLGELVSRYNAMLSNAENNDAGRMYKELASVTASYAGTLSKLGINVDDDGHLSIDKEKATEAIESGATQSALSSDNWGFTSRLDRSLNNIASNPSYYNGSGSSFRMYNSQAFYNYMYMENSGMLFNFSV